MLITVEEIRQGDEIIIGSNSHLRYLKVIRPPRLRKKPQARGGKYTNAWCSSKIDVIEHKRGTPYPYIWKERKRYCALPEEHNIERYENLNYIEAWLVKREQK